MQGTFTFIFSNKIIPMKTLLFSLGLMACTTLMAQVNKGNVLLGGHAGIYFGTSQPNLQSQTNSNLSPSLQFGYATNRMVGLSLDMAWQQSKGNDGASRSNQFSLAPTVQFTQLHPLKGNLGWWLQQSVGMGLYRTKQVNASAEQTSSSTSVFAALTPGVYYAAGERKQWLLTASVGHLNVSHTWQGQSDFTTTAIGTSLFRSFQFGFAYVLGSGGQR